MMVLVAGTIAVALHGPDNSLTGSSPCRMFWFSFDAVHPVLTGMAPFGDESVAQEEAGNLFQLTYLLG